MFAGRCSIPTSFCSSINRVVHATVRCACYFEKSIHEILHRHLAYVFLVAWQFCNGEEPTTVSFRSEIAPILLDNCLACHGAKKAEGGYRVDSYEELIKAGDSGELPIAASADQVSELLRRITCEDESERMPAESEPLSPEQIELIKQWIAAAESSMVKTPVSHWLSLFLPFNTLTRPKSTLKQYRLRQQHSLPTVN